MNFSVDPLPPFKIRMGEGASVDGMMILFPLKLKLRLPHFRSTCPMYFSGEKWGRKEGVKMHRLPYIFFLCILLTAYGPAPAATSAPATETFLQARYLRRM
jgi:hypothetical protein